MNQVAGMPNFLSSASTRAAPITPNSPRETGVGVVMPRAIQPEIASKSKVMQTMCFATRSSLSAVGPTEHDRSIHAGAACLHPRLSLLVDNARHRSQFFRHRTYHKGLDRRWKDENRKVSGPCRAVRRCRGRLRASVSLEADPHGC